MKRPLLTAALASLSLLAVAAVASAADRPPRDLHLVGDHWTAWDPPVPPPGRQVYVIQRGDTLWDLANRYYGDPYLWPQLWEQNRYILDAHWIYPGDPLDVGVEVEPVDSLAELTAGDEAAPTETVPEEGGSSILSAAAASGAPQPLGTESDIYCTGFIDADARAFPYSIVGSEYQALSPSLDPSRGLGEAAYRTRYGTDTLKYGLMNGDIVYLDGGRAGGLAAGDLLTVVHPEEMVHHPLAHDVVGRFYRYLGRVRVLSVQPDTAIGEIVHTCDPITVGSFLEAFQPEPVPLGRLTTMRPINLPVPESSLDGAPTILRGEDNVVTLGEDSLVYIDRGEGDDVVAGDVYTIYRRNRPGLPPIVLGELAVLSVHPRSSVARILRSRYTVYVGDRLERKN